MSGNGPAILFVIETRLERDAAGAVYGSSAANDRLWADYLQVLDNVTVAARVKDVDYVDDLDEITAVKVDPVEYYEGLRGLVRKLPHVVLDLAHSVDAADVIVVRVPGVLGYVASALAHVKGKPYAAEVGGDPEDVLRSMHGRSLIGRGAARVAGSFMRTLVKHAAAVKYVTQEALQMRYPPSHDSLAIVVRNVILDDEAYNADFQFPETGDHLRLLTIGSQNTNYKGHDIALRVVAELNKVRPTTLSIIGSGSLHQSYIQMTEDLGISDHVRFIGHVRDRSIINRELDNAHVFLMPSRTEGLPRAINEAQARSLPVVGSRVGGIPELVHPSLCVAAEDVAAYVQAILGLTQNREWYESEARRGFEISWPLRRTKRTERFADWARALISLADHSSLDASSSSRSI